jgi:hypothetical protein
MRFSSSAFLSAVSRSMLPRLRPAPGRLPPVPGRLPPCPWLDDFSVIYGALSFFFIAVRKSSFICPSRRPRDLSVVLIQ